MAARDEVEEQPPVDHRLIVGMWVTARVAATAVVAVAVLMLAGWVFNIEMLRTSIGASLFVISTIVLFTTLIWWNASSFNRIEADRSRAQRELQQKTAILKSVLHSMGDGVVVADRDGRFLIFNPVAERILGLGATDAPPEEWTSRYGLFSPETGEPLQLDQIPLVRAIRGESTDQQELLIKSPKLPEGVYISVTGRPLQGDEGIEGGVVVFQDTTQRRRAAEAIRRARDEADAANRAKSEFLANMSHEIRTPMNAVIGMTELVLDSELSTVQRTYLKIVKDSAESLLSLINDILDFSKIEAGKLELDHTPFQLRDMLGDALKTLSVRARGKDLELACHVGPEVPEFLMGDPHRLRQVVTNLVGNALKFTEHGEVVLDVSSEDAGDRHVRLHIAVRDTGIGIPAEKLHLLFGAFSQVDASTTRRYGGTGLGLAITARLVQLMHGRTWVDSEPGKGSTFHFTAQFETGSSPPAPAPLEALQNLRVLIVDDNATNRLILQEMLVAWGLRPLAVASAAAALDELQRAADAEDPFRLVLSDVQMPDVDGFELTSRIRQDGRFGSTVIMMLSSGAGPGDVARCRELGAATHLMKPIKSSELFETLAAVMGSEVHAEVPRVTGDAAIRPLHILLAEDSETNQQLALGVLGKWGHSLTIVNNGREAVAAFERGRFDVILMDVQMPEMDGFQAAALIRSKELHQGGHVPIVAMTAHAMKGDREECLHSGMDDYVTKPIRWHELREALERAARENARQTESVIEKSGSWEGEAPAEPSTTAGRRPPEALSDASGGRRVEARIRLGGSLALPCQTLTESDKTDSTTPRADSKPDASSVVDDSLVQHPDPILPQSTDEPQTWKLDWNEALRGVDGDQELLRLVLGELLKEWPKLVAELNRAALAGDAVTLRRAAHTIRGSLRLFGYSEPVHLAEQIENLAQSNKVNDVPPLLSTFHQQANPVLQEIERRLNSQR